MRVQTEEWRRFIPGVRMYKGKKTLFWNGERLWDGWYNEFLIYNKEEQLSWEVIIILPEVEEIPKRAFGAGYTIEAVIMADTVKRIAESAFSSCNSLTFVKLSTSLEYIGFCAFYECNSLTSIFIPPSCREIGSWAFQGCKKLVILSVPQHARLGNNVIARTALIKKSPFRTDEDGNYEYNRNDEEAVIEWVKSINNGEAYALASPCFCFLQSLV